MHAFSNEEILQTLPVQEIVARQAISMAEGLPLHVGPVTLLQRFNPVATDKVRATGPETDPRQNSLWAACWALGSVSALARAGAKVLTYFETVRPRGVMSPRRGGFALTARVIPRFTRCSATWLIIAGPDWFISKRPMTTP